jgi:hypothetical protein
MTRSAGIARAVVGVDFDEASTAALIVASELASEGEAAITLLHATTLEMPAYFTSAQMEALEEDRQQDRPPPRRPSCVLTPHVAGRFDTVVEEGTPEAAIPAGAVIRSHHCRHTTGSWSSSLVAGLHG